MRTDTSVNTVELSPLNRIYRHYGSPRFLKYKQAPVSGTRMMKPLGGGLWASPVDSDRTWHQWCIDEHWNEDSLQEYFDFQLTNNAKIFVINSADDFFKFLYMFPSDRILEEYEKIIYKPFVTADKREVVCYPDYLKVSQMYDGVEVNISRDYDLYYRMYGWDVDSIVVWNYDVIEELKTK